MDLSWFTRRRLGFLSTCMLANTYSSNALAMLREALAKNDDRLDEVLAAMKTARRKDIP
jgi:hypothetical protein